MVSFEKARQLAQLYAATHYPDMQLPSPNPTGREDSESWLVCIDNPDIFGWPMFLVDKQTGEVSILAYHPLRASGKRVEKMTPVPAAQRRRG